MNCSKIKSKLIAFTLIHQKCWHVLIKTLQILGEIVVIIYCLYNMFLEFWRAIVIVITSPGATFRFGCSQFCLNKCINESIFSRIYRWDIVLVSIIIFIEHRWKRLVGKGKQQMIWCKSMKVCWSSLTLVMGWAFIRASTSHIKAHTDQTQCNYFYSLVWRFCIVALQNKNQHV